MYLPEIFKEDRQEVLLALMRAHPLATLITGGAGGLLANPVVFQLAEAAGRLVLRAHLSRANDQVAALREGAEALAVFQGPQAYVTPSWYPSKAEHGKVVPTWNYVTVQAHGVPRVVQDREWLL